MTAFTLSTTVYHLLSHNVTFCQVNIKHTRSRKEVNVFSSTLTDVVCWFVSSLYSCTLLCAPGHRINSCVGQANHRSFLLTLLFFLTTSLYGISLVLRSVCPRRNLVTALIYCPGVYNQYRYKKIKTGIQDGFVIFTQDLSSIQKH